MKRSEMIEIIKNSLRSVLGGHEFEKCAESVMDALEKAGMLPPYSEKSEEVNLTVKSTSSKYAMFYKWEPENETK